MNKIIKIGHCQSRKHSGKGRKCWLLAFFSFLNYLLNPFLNNPMFLRVCTTSLLKTQGKGEISHNEQFLLLPQYFLSFKRTFCHFYQI